MQNTTRILIGIVATIGVALTALSIDDSAAADGAAPGPTEARSIAWLATTAPAPAPAPVPAPAPAPAPAERPPAPAPVPVLAPDPTPEAPEGLSFGVDSEGNRFPSADPALVRDGEVWRLFTTQAGLSNVPTWESAELVDWTWTGDALPTLPGWARWGLTWAPDAVELDGRWILYFSALYGETDLHCVGHAVADTPTGPYEPFADPIVCELDEGGTIDPVVHVDSVGDPHLLWKVDANAIGRDSILRSQRLSADGLRLIGEPAELLRYAGGWEWPLIEQPEIVERDGQVHLFYAAGWFNTDGYQVGHAVCEGLRGPCERTSTDGGWITSTAGIEGPGALSLEPFGDDYVGVYHAWTNGVRPEDGEFRSLVVERFAIDDGRPVAIGA